MQRVRLISLLTFTANFEVLVCWDCQTFFNHPNQILLIFFLFFNLVSYFVANATNLWFSNVFRGYRNGTLSEIRLDKVFASKWIKLPHPNPGKPGSISHLLELILLVAFIFISWKKYVLVKSWFHFYNRANSDVFILLIEMIFKHDYFLQSFSYILNSIAVWTYSRKHDQGHQILYAELKGCHFNKFWSVNYCYKSK